MAIVLNTPAIILAPFMTNFLGIGAGAAAALLLASKLYDMATDPLMGIASDRTRSRYGRRRPYLLLGGFISAAGFFLTFNPHLAPGGQTWLVAFMLAALLVTCTGYTIFNIPYLAMPAEMTDSYHERTSLMSHRIFFVNCGMLVSAFSPLLVEWLGKDRAAHGAMGWIYATLILLASVYGFFGTAAARQTEGARKKTHSILMQVRTAFGNRPLRLLLGAKLCQLLGFASVGATGLYFKVVILGMSYALATAYQVTGVLVILLVLPLWSIASRKYGKRSIYMVCAAGYALVTATWLLATAEDPLYSFFVRAAFLGLFASGVLVMAPSLLPDAVEYDYLKTGMRREATISAFYTTVEKFSFAVGPALALAILEAYGYRSGTEGLQIEQPDSAITAIYLGAGLAPAALYALSLVFLARYDLTEEKLKAMRRLRQA